MLIRPEQSDDTVPQARDRAAIADILTAAFGRDAEAQLIDRIRSSDRAWFGNVAEQDGAIVGHIFMSAVDLDESVQVWALAPIAVHPDYQRQGIGTRLVKTAIEQAACTDFPLIVVLGHAKFYAGCGFEPAADYEITAPFDVPSEVFRIKRLPLFAGQRGAIKYPDAFSGL